MDDTMIPEVKEFTYENVLAEMNEMSDLKWMARYLVIGARVLLRTAQLRMTLGGGCPCTTQGCGVITTSFSHSFVQRFDMFFAGAVLAEFMRFGPPVVKYNHQRGSFAQGYSPFPLRLFVLPRAESRLQLAFAPLAGMVMLLEPVVSCVAAVVAPANVPMPVRLAIAPLFATLAVYPLSRVCDAILTGSTTSLNYHGVVLAMAVTATTVLEGYLE